MAEHKSLYESNTLKDLVSDVGNRFWRKSTTIGPGGRFEKFTPEAAAEEQFIELGIQGSEVLPDLIEQTSLRPYDLSHISTDPDEPWKEFIRKLALNIVACELKKQPGVETEVEAREREEQALDYPDLD